MKCCTPFQSVATSCRKCYTLFWNEVLHTVSE